MACLRHNLEAGIRPTVAGDCNLASPAEPSEVLEECWASLVYEMGYVRRVLEEERCNAGAEVWAGLQEPTEKGRTEGRTAGSHQAGKVGKSVLSPGVMRPGAVEEGPLLALVAVCSQGHSGHLGGQGC